MIGLLFLSRFLGLCLLAIGLVPARAAEETAASFSGTYLGVYTYGASFGPQREGKMVKFRLKLTQAQGDGSFTGTVDEEYTDFGTPKDNRLHALVQGEISPEEGTVRLRMVKTYRYFEQESVQYSGVFDPERKSFDGSFSFASNDARGTFTLQRAQ